MSSTETPPTEQPPVDPHAVSVTLNGTPITARKGELIIEAAERAGEYIPRFCYHHRMNPVGMCRMCLVEVDSGRGPQITPSCMVSVAPDMKIVTDSPTVTRIQEGVLELLLANHPLDCPVCDKGGECPLQDQAFSHGPGESRYLEEKRHFEKPIPISDLVLLDRERCILCDRCTRFADEVAGDALIHFTSRGNTTHITTFPDQPFSSYFSGNTVQICPVGALTATPYRFKARPWDLSQSESTCTTCSVGCRIVVQSSRDEVLRYMGVDSDPVNWGWLCDRGRFGFQAINSEARVTQPLVRIDGELQPTGWSEAIAAAARLIGEATAAGGAESVVVLGGARGTNEDAFAWARLAHDIIGTPNVSAQLGDGLPVGVLALERATIDEAATADTVILLGPDLKEELPVLYLRLRDSAVKRRTKLVEFTPKPGGLTRYAWKSIGYEPGTQVGAVHHALADPEIATQLGAGKVVIVVGRANLAETSAATVAALHELRAAVPTAKVLPALRRGNVVGAIQLGMRPGVNGMDSRAALAAAAEGRVECLILVGCDPLSDVADVDLARRAVAGARRIIAVDTNLSPSSARADVVLAAAAAGEKAGTTTNIEGRVTTVSQQITPRGVTRPDWMIAAELAAALGGDLGVESADDVLAAIAELNDSYADITIETLGQASDGVLTNLAATLDPINPPVVAIPDRNSYDYRLVVSRKLYDAAIGTANSPALAGLATTATIHLHPLDLERVGTSDGAQVRVTSPKTTIVLTATADDTVLRGTAWVPFNQPGSTVGELIDATAAVTDLRIETL